MRLPPPPRRRRPIRSNSLTRSSSPIRSSRKRPQHDQPEEIRLDENGFDVLIGGQSHFRVNWSAVRGIAAFKGQARFSSWLYRITLNLCRDWMRRERRTPVSQAPEGLDIIELAGEGPAAESIEDVLSRNQLGRAVEKAMALLPEEQRTAIIMKEYHGLTFQEIADLLDCPLSTVKTRLYQGLTVLRKQLEHDGVQGRF